MAAVVLLPIFKSFCDAYSLSGKTNGALTTLEYWSSPAGFWLLSDPLQELFLLPFFHLTASENYFPPQEIAFQGNHRGLHMNKSWAEKDTIGALHMNKSWAEKDTMPTLLCR